MKESHFEKLLRHGQNMKSGRRHSLQVFFLSFHIFFFGVIEDGMQLFEVCMIGYIIFLLEITES